MKFALNALPETLINMLQSAVSLRRIEKYLHGAEVAAIAPLSVPTPSLATTPLSSQPIALQNATITWPQDRTRGTSTAPSVASTPRHKFMLVDLSLNFPVGELSLVCGKLGSGKTLLLLALLGEADLLTGQVVCPRSPPDALARFAVERPGEEDWIVPGICAYVPQVRVVCCVTSTRSSDIEVNSPHGSVMHPFEVSYLYVSLIYEYDLTEPA